MKRAKIVAEELAKFRHGNDLKKFRDVLYAIATNEANDARDRISAIKEWHDRAYGKPAQEITGADGEPLIPTNAELESRLAAALAGSVTADDASTEGEPH